MPQITKDPLGNDVELLNLTEWSEKNQRELNEDTLNQYAGYATGQFLRAGQARESFENDLYGSLYQKGQEAGIFQPQSDEEANQQFQNFTSKPFVNDALDLDLVSKSLLDTEPEQAAKVADVYQRLASGQADPNLDLDLEDVKTNIATPDRIQQARIDYAKERGLAFIDYPTGDGKRDVWINTQIKPDRNAIYGTLETTQGIIDPRAAQQAEEWIKTDPGRTMSNAERRRLGELQEQFQQQIEADPNSLIAKRLGSTTEFASEVANEFGAREADLTGKAASEVVYDNVPLSTPYGTIYTPAERKTVSRTKIADAVLRNTYAQIKEKDPNNVLVTEYTEEEFLNAGRDFALQRMNVPTDRKDPTKNFVTLTDGTRMPLSSAAILPQKEFNQAMDKLGLDEQERALAKTVKTGWIAANLVPIQDALYDYESDELMDFYEKNKDVYKNDVEFTEAYIDQMKVDGWKTFKAKAAGIAWSLPRAFHDLGWGLAFLAGRAVGGVTGWNGMSDFTAGVLEQGAELDQRRSTYTDLYGSKTGAIYEFASQAAPMLADIIAARGAGMVAKKVAKGAVNVGIKSAEKVMGESAKNLIKSSLKDETKGIIGNYLKPFTVGGIERNPSKMLRAVRRDLEEKFVTGSARATQLGASFTRSAQGTYVNTSMTMRSETNPDGSPKYTEDEIRKTATANALVSGSITALVEYGFGRVFGEGADITTLGNANIRQLKYYSNRLTGAIQRGGFGGQELLDTVNQVTKEIVKKGWGDAAKEIPAEAFEEFTSDFSQNIALSLLNDENVNFKEAFEQGLKAAVMGGGYGAIFGTTNKIGLRKANVIRDTVMGDAQRIERDIMDQTIAKLQEAGGNPQTVAALQERVRMAQRRGQAVSQTIPVRTQAKQDLVGQIDAVEENPIEISATTTTTQNKPAVDAKPTKLAAQEAKKLGVTDDELKFIPPSGKNQSITPNDVRAYVNRRTENLGVTLSGFLPGQEITAPEGGFQSIGEDQIDDPEQRTFNDLNNRVVIIDGLRGRLRIEDEGVILDPEDGSTPFEVTPNKDLPIKDFEGFDTLLQEGAQVTPRRQPREVAEVTDGGQIVYGETTYDLPEQPLLANVKRDAAGEIESMHMRVFNSKGLATWVYVAGDNVPKVETAYRVRGPESVVTYNNAVENSRAENVKRNAAANSFKAKQSRARRKKKRIENNAPYVSDTAQETVQASADYRMAKINDPDAPKQLIEEIRGIALQLGIDPDVVTDNAELFAMVAPDLAAGLDLESFTPRQIAKAIENLRRSGNNPETLLEYALLDEVLDPVQRVTRDSKLAALRARNSNQIKKHGLKPGADVKKALESIARTAANKEHREAAKALLELEAYNTPVSFVYLSNNLGTAGAYLPSSNAVVVNLASDNGGGALDALLHELGHAVTDRVVTNPRNEHERQLRDKLLALRAEYMNRANNLFGENNVPPDLRYALEGRMYTSEQYDEISGAREMVAHFYGSKRFREYLAQMSPEGERSFIQKFIDLIASIFGRGEASTRQYRELANLVSDISRANQTLGDSPYGRSTAQYAASRAAVNKANRVGPLFGVENPHPREDVKWIIHQVQTLRFADYSNEEFNEMILNGKFGMLTGEFPNAVDGVTEADNARFNREATKWLRDRGYEIIPIAGHYERGENSFFVPGLTDQDAVDASYELNQVSVVTDTGSYSRDGMFSPRTGQAINKPIQEEGDAYFSAVLDTNGNVTTMRVHYDFDTVLDSGLRYSKQDTQASPTTKIARSLAAQNEFVVAESSETNRPLHFENGVLIVNPALAEARYGEFDVEDSADLQELDARLAVATGLAVQSSGPEIQLDLEEVGLSPETVIEQAAYNDLTKSDLEDLLKVKDQAKQLVASAYYQVALRNDGSNERLATAQNRLADLYRYLLRDGAEPSDTVEKYNPYEVSDLTARIAERAKPPLPIVRFSRAAAEIDPKQVRSRTKAGATVGTRNPTAAKATEDGSDPSNTVDLATLKRNPKAYRKNALLLLEYPIVAREFPELAKEYADLRNKVVNAQEEAKSNGGNISSAKLAAKKILAKHLGNISVTKVKSQMFEDARENPEKEVSGKYLAEFKAAIENISNYEKKGVELVADSKKALKEFGDALDAMAVDNNHPIAEQADRIYETLIDVSRSNLEMLMKIFPDSIRDIADLWYDGANLIAQQFAGDKYTIEQSAAVLAVFSPQKDWFMNVELGRRTMEIWTDDQDYVWDDAMSKRWLMRGGEPELIERKDGSLGYKGDIKPDLDENGEHRTDENGMLLFLGWSSSKAEARRKLAFERLKDLKGKKLKDLTPEQQAWFIRMRAETKYPTSFPIVTPDGDFEGPSTSTNNKGEVREIKLAWGTYGSIGKAIEILTAPRETQMKVISDALGDKHKVRSFYNNIVDPQNTSGHVTMDTHAIAALHLIPLSGNSREVSQNFGSAGTASDSLTGIAGLYPAYAEVYRRSGFDRLPRQVQSITWEAIRILFPAKWKSDSKNVNAIRDIWKRYQSKEITLAEAQSEVFEKATGGKDLEVAIKNSDNPELNIPFPSWAKITEGPAPAGAGIALSRAGFEPVRLTKQQRTDSVELIKSLKGGDRKTRTNVIAGLVKLSNDDMLSITERLSKEDLRWLIGPESENLGKFDLLSRFRRTIRKQIEMLPQYQDGAVVFREDDLQRAPVDRLAARIARSRSDVEKLNTPSGISLQSFAAAFASEIRPETKTIQDVDIIADSIIRDHSDNPEKYIVKATEEGIAKAYKRYLRMPDGTDYDPEKLSHSNASDLTIQIYEQIRDGGFDYSVQRTVEKINKDRADAIRGMADYLLGNTEDYSRAEAAILLVAASKYATRSEPDKNNPGKLSYRVVDMGGDNELKPFIADASVAAAVIGNLRSGKNIKESTRLAFEDSQKKNAETSEKYGTGWHIFRQSDKYEDAVELNSACAGTSWCTGGRVDTARDHRSGGDFHVYFKDGKPEVAIRTTNGKLAEPPRGNTPNQSRTAEHEAILNEYLNKDSGVSGADDYLHDVALLDRVVAENGFSQFTDLELATVPTKRKSDNGYGRDAQQWPLAFEKAWQKELKSRKSILSEPLGSYSTSQLENAEYIVTAQSAQALHLQRHPKLIATNHSILCSDVDEHKNLVHCANIINVKGKVSLPKLQKTGVIKNIDEDSEIIIPNVLELKTISAVDGKIVAQNLKKVSRIFEVSSKGSLELPSLEETSNITDIGGKLNAPNLKSVNEIYQVHANISLPSLEVIKGTLTSTGNKSDIFYDFPKLKTINGDLKGIGDARFNFPELLRVEGGMDIGYAWFNLPKLRRVAGAINFLRDKAEVNMPELRHAGAIQRYMPVKNTDLPGLAFVGGRKARWDTEQGGVVFDEETTVTPDIREFLAPSIALSRAKLDAVPKAFRGRMVQLTHWSKATELKQTDPAEHGNGGAGEELKRRREYGDIYLPRTYFGYGKYHREQWIGGYRYSMLVNGNSLYDLDRDPLDLYPDQDALQKAGYARFDTRAAKTLYERAIKDAGFKGYVSTSFQAGVLFNKQKVTKVRDANTSLPLAAPASIAKSLANLTPATPAEEKAAAGALGSKRVPELAVAAVRMIEGVITVDDYADLVEFFDPWEVKGAGEIPSRDKIRQYMPGLNTGTERAKERLEKTFADAPDGKLVEVRIDIPTFNNSLSFNDPVYAITLHEPEKDDGKKIGDPIVYTNIARVLNPTMVVRGIGKKEARDIAAGASKTPLATVKGRNATITELPADINDPEVWTEVGFNPVRSSDFVDVRSKLAVVGGSEAIMVGPRVFVKDAEFAERATGYMTKDNPRFSKALYAIVSPDVESAYAVSLEDLYINNATGEWDAGGPIKNLFRAAGDLDPRLFEAAKYQERGLKLAKVRLKDLIQGFKAALKAEPNADLDDINVALGSTEPTVSAAQRDAAESARRARVDKANEQFDRDPANQAYAAAVEAARVAYATHRNKQKYTAEIQQARDARKNSPEMQRRDAAIAAADAQYAKDIQDARAKNLIPIRRAQQQAQLRLEANSPQTAQVIADFRVAIDNLSAQLSAELGPSNPLSAIVDQNLGIYLTRSYRIHQDEGYAQRVRNDSEFAHQREQARQFFEREWIATTYEKWRSDVAYEPYSDAEVMALVRAEAASKNVGTRDLYKFIDKHGSTPKTIGRTTSRTDLTRFMQKGEVPAELRPLLGEIQNPIENAMRTYANLAQFLGTQRLLSQYTQLGLDNGWLVPAADVDNDPVKYDGYKPLVNSTDTRGGEPLSEYYAQPDVIEAFQTMFNPAAKAQRSYAKKAIVLLGAVAARAVGTSMGAMTLGSAGFFMRNLTGILTFVGANGFIPTPSNIITAYRTLKEVYGKNMEGLGADAVMLGLTEDSLISTTMRDFMRNAIEDPDTATNQIESMLNELSTPGNWLAKSWNTAKVTVDGLTTINDQIDSFYKIAYWAHEIDVQTKANKYRATPLTPQQIKQEAARVVRQTTQGRERVAPIAKEFGRSGFGLLLNSFFRFTAEMYRLPVATTQLAVQEMKSGNPVLRNRGITRLIGLGGVLAMTGHGAQALLKYLLGFGDDEEEAIRKGQPVYNRDANLFFTHDPEEGTVSVFDITYVNGFSPVVDMFGRSIHHAVNGRWEKVPGTILSAIAKNFVSPQIAVEALAQASSNTNDYGAALWLEDDSFTTKASKFLKHLIGNAYKLKTPTNFYKAFAAYANNGVYDKDAALKLAGKLASEFKPLRVKTDPVEEHAARSFRVLKREMDVARRSLGDFNSFESLSQEDVDEIYDRYENSSIAINERLNKFARGFQKLGLTYKQLQKIAYEEADISKNRFEQAVKYGRVERFVPSDDALEMYKNRGEDNGPARVQYIKQAYKKRPRYTYLKKR